MKHIGLDDLEVAGDDEGTRATLLEGVVISGYWDAAAPTSLGSQLLFMATKSDPTCSTCTGPRC